MKIEIQKFYKSRSGTIVQIVDFIAETEPCYQEGFRFRDQNRESYKANGHWGFRDKQKNDKDLIEEVL